MKVNKVYGCLYAAFILVLLGSLTGCGGGSSGTNAGSNSQSSGGSSAAAITVVSSGNGQYAVQGANMDGVAAIDLTISYEGSALSSPIVTQGAFISGLLMATNTNTPGSIRIGCVGSTPLSGSGLIASISFSTGPGQATVSISSSKMTDINGTVIP